MFSSNFFNCFTFTASKSLVPPATPTIRRVTPRPSAVLRMLPIESTPLPLLFTLSPVKYAVVASASAFTAVDALPNVMACSISVLAPLPIVIALLANVLAEKPIAIAYSEAVSVAVIPLPEPDRVA